MRIPTAGSPGSDPSSGLGGSRSSGAIIDLRPSASSSSRVRFPALYRPAGGVLTRPTTGSTTPGRTASIPSIRSQPRPTGTDVARPSDRVRRTNPTDSLGRGRLDALSTNGGRLNPLDLPLDTSSRPRRVEYGRGPVQRLSSPTRTSSSPAPRSIGTTRKPRPTTGIASVGSVSPRGKTGVRGVPSGKRTNLGDLQARDATAAGRIQSVGRNLDRARRAGIAGALSTIGGVRSTPYSGGRGGNGYGGGHHGGGHYGGGHNGYYNPWGYGYYGGHFSFGFGFNWYWGDGWWYWPSYISSYYPYWYNVYRPYYYGSYYYPTVYSTVVYRTVYEDAQGSGETIVEAPAGESVVPRSEAAVLSIAAERYLTLGDRAFREARWADAVQLYAKAVELAPDNAGLYLVLADALFAAGDYHYAAYAIRKAVELDPLLLSAPIDKHGFYLDASDFDAQLARLELYLLESPTDRDARLVLAVNFLFGNRPAGAVDLYAEGSSSPAALSQDEAVRLMLDSARAQQFGQTEPSGAAATDGL